MIELRIKVSYDGGGYCRRKYDIMSEEEQPFEKELLERAVSLYADKDKFSSKIEVGKEVEERFTLVGSSK